MPRFGGIAFHRGVKPLLQCRQFECEIFRLPAGTAGATYNGVVPTHALGDRHVASAYVRRRFRWLSSGVRRSRPGRFRELLVFSDDLYRFIAAADVLLRGDEKFVLRKSQPIGRQKDRLVQANLDRISVIRRPHPTRRDHWAFRAHLHFALRPSVMGNLDTLLGSKTFHQDRLISVRRHAFERDCLNPESIRRENESLVRKLICDLGRRLACGRGQREMCQARGQFFQRRRISG